MPMYEVATHAHGRPVVKRGPMEGLPNFEQHKWTRITARPVGLDRAKALADAQDGHAVVCEWQTTKKVYDNGKAPTLPEGWKPA